MRSPLEQEILEEMSMAAIRPKTELGRKVTNVCPEMLLFGDEEESKRPAQKPSSRPLLLVPRLSTMAFD